jgi:hypothetical protein
MERQDRFRLAISLRSEPLIEQPKRKRLAYLPTKKQMMFIRDLSGQLGLYVERPKTKAEAADVIDDLIELRKSYKGGVRRRSSGSGSRAPHLGVLPPGLEPKHPG